MIEPIALQNSKEWYDYLTPHYRGRNHSTMNVLEILACPLCGGKLHAEAAVVNCVNCDKRYSVVDDIYLLTESSDFYYNLKSVPRGKMEEFFRDAQIFGWRQAYERLLKSTLGKYNIPTRGVKGFLKSIHQTLSGTGVESIIQNVLDETRAGWKFLLDIQPNGTVLDYGCGWGPISHNLARSFAHVFALDLSVDRLRFSKLRAEEEGTSNITFVSAGNLPRIPFVDNSFDVVVLNGVLEWIPTSRKGDPIQLQIDLLSEIRRVLKPSGQLYIGIENRFSILDLVGFPEGHTGLIYGGVMPRWLANFYSRLLRHEDFRVYTHSYYKLREIARKAGFQHTHFYSPVPTYRKFNQIVDLHQTESMNISTGFLKKKRPLRALTSMYDKLNRNGRLEQLLYKGIPTFGIILTQTPNQRTNFVSKILNSIVTMMGYDVSDYRIDNYLVRNDIIVLIVSSVKFPGFVIRLPITEVRGQICDKHVAFLRSVIDDDRLPHSLKKLFPRILIAGEQDGQPYFVETKLKGKTGSYFVRKSQYEKAITEAVNIHDQIRMYTSALTILDETEFDRLYGTRLRRLRKIISESEVQECLAKIESFLKKSLLETQLPLGWCHGDYHLVNLRFNGKEEVTGILDFEHFEEKGLPLIDLLALFGYKPYLKNDLCFGRHFIEHIFVRNFDATEMAVLDRHIDDLSISQTTYQAIALWYWLNHIYTHCNGYIVYSQRWLNNNFYAVMDYLNKYIG